MTLIVQQKQVKQFSRARLARDPKFDGLFFTAVKTTGIYCRSICPASAPKEENVEYYQTAISAAKAGFRPCLRCRPDSAPTSSAWHGTDTTVKRAFCLIEEGIGTEQSIEKISERLGISSRYLRELFVKKVGVSPQKYISYQRVLLAKKLLHETSLSMSSVAYSAGFSSVRSFNDSVKNQLKMTPSEIRKKSSKSKLKDNGIKLKLSYRPPFDWQAMLEFLEKRMIAGVEWQCDGVYGRTLKQDSGAHGYFEVWHDKTKPVLHLKLVLNQEQDLYPVIQTLRVLFDMDAPIDEIENVIHEVIGKDIKLHHGLRIPGILGTFEAGVRAILGQQVSVEQAHRLVQTIVNELGEPIDIKGKGVLTLFPSPHAVANSDLGFFKMPQSRKDTLRRLAAHFLTSQNPDNIDQWLSIKGIGPWTVNYVKLRATNDPDVWLEGDAGVKNALKLLDDSFEPGQAAPWRSYLVFQLWHSL